MGRADIVVIAEIKEHLSFFSNSADAQGGEASLLAEATGFHGHRAHVERTQKDAEAGAAFI